jgi:hypothetical protein
MQEYTILTSQHYMQRILRTTSEQQPLLTLTRLQGSKTVLESGITSSIYDMMLCMIEQYKVGTDQPSQYTDTSYSSSSNSKESSRIVKRTVSVSTS